MPTPTEIAAVTSSTDAALMVERQRRAEAVAEQQTARQAAETKLALSTEENVVLKAQLATVETENALLKQKLAECQQQPEPPPPPPVPEPPSSPVRHRNRFLGGKHAETPGFIYHPPAAGANSRFLFTKDEMGREVYRLEVSGDRDDNRNEQRVTIPRMTKGFIGFLRRAAPHWDHDNLDGPDNYKQLRLFSEPYDKAGGIHLGFSLLPRTNDPAGSILFECTSQTSSGGKLEPCDNKGTWDRVCVPGELERWGFEFALASGPGKRDGMIRFWLNGVDLMARSTAKTGFNWNALDLWNYTSGGRNYFDRLFFPGWDNAGSDNPEWLDFHELVVADSPLPEYTTP